MRTRSWVLAIPGFASRGSWVVGRGWPSTFNSIATVHPWIDTRYHGGRVPVSLPRETKNCERYMLEPRSTVFWCGCRIYLTVIPYPVYGMREYFGLALITFGCDFEKVVRIHGSYNASNCRNGLLWGDRKKKEVFWNCSGDPSSCFQDTWHILASWFQAIVFANVIVPQQPDHHGVTGFRWYKIYWR